MCVYHNPNAKHPIPIDFFKEFSGRHWFENGSYDNLFRDFSPYASLTITFSTDARQDTLSELDDKLRELAVKKADELDAAMHGHLELTKHQEIKELEVQAKQVEQAMKALG